MLSVTTPGRILKRRREAAGLTQQALATLLDVSMPIVSQWERDIATPRRDNAEKIDDALKADGEVLAAFGYAPAADGGTRHTEITRRLDQLEELVAELLQGQVTLVAGQKEGIASIDGKVGEVLAEVRLLSEMSRRPSRRAAQ